MTRLIAAMAVAVVLLGAGLPGCRCRPQSSGAGPEGPIVRQGKPDYAALASAYNPRVSSLVRIWASMVVRLTYADADGVIRDEQFDGVVQYVAPSKALLTFRKYSQEFALLGSDGERYWWIELDKVKRATIGRHDMATPERLARAGLPVHPLDLVELLALTPLPPEGEAEWSKDGRWAVVTVPARNGVRKVWIDPATHEPGRVQIVGAGGVVLAESGLKKFENMALKGASADALRPRVPTHVTVEAGKTRLILDISQQQDDPARFRPATFSFEKLTGLYGIEAFQDLDAHPAQ